MLMTPWEHSIPEKNRKGPIMSEERDVKGSCRSVPWREKPVAFHMDASTSGMKERLTDADVELFF